MSFSEQSKVAFWLRRSTLVLALLFVTSTANTTAAEPPPEEDPEEIEIDGLAAPDSGPVFRLCRLMKRC